MKSWFKIQNSVNGIIHISEQKLISRDDRFGMGIRKWLIIKTSNKLKTENYFLTLMRDISEEPTADLTLWGKREYFPSRIKNMVRMSVLQADEMMLVIKPYNRSSSSGAHMVGETLTSANAMVYLQVCARTHTQAYIC